jgi:hypothetical protein
MIHLSFLKIVPFPRNRANLKAASARLTRVLEPSTRRYVLRSVLAFSRNFDDVVIAPFLSSMRCLRPSDQKFVRSGPTIDNAQKSLLAFANSQRRRVPQNHPSRNSPNLAVPLCAGIMATKESILAGGSLSTMRLILLAAYHRLN